MFTSYSVFAVILGIVGRTSQRNWRKFWICCNDNFCLSPLGVSFGCMLGYFMDWCCDYTFFYVSSKLFSLDSAQATFSGWLCGKKLLCAELFLMFKMGIYLLADNYRWKHISYKKCDMGIKSWNWSIQLVVRTTIIEDYFMDCFQANGLEKTWIFLGGYFYKSEQTGWYRTDYVYPCTIAAMFLISLLAILAT